MIDTRDNYHVIAQQFIFVCFVQSSHPTTCNKLLQDSPNMDRRRRQSAWARSQSLNQEVNKPISKRRMSEVSIGKLILFLNFFYP